MMKIQKVRNYGKEQPTMDEGRLLAIESEIIMYSSSPFLS